MFVIGGEAGGAISGVPWGEAASLHVQVGWDPVRCSVTWKNSINQGPLNSGSVTLPGGGFTRRCFIKVSMSSTENMQIGSRASGGLKWSGLGVFRVLKGAFKGLI